MNNARKKVMIGIYVVCGTIIFLGALGSFVEDNKEKKAAEVARIEAEERNKAAEAARIEEEQKFEAFMAQHEAKWQTKKDEFALHKHAIMSEMINQGMDRNYIDSFEMITENVFELNILLPSELIEQSFLSSNAKNFEDWTKSYATQIVNTVEHIIPNIHTGVSHERISVCVTLGFINHFGTTTSIGYLQFLDEKEAWVFLAPGLFRDVNPQRLNRQQNVANSNTLTNQQQQNLVYVTNTGKSYHRQGCRHLQSVAGSGTASDFANRGYSACSVCRP